MSSPASATPPPSPASRKGSFLGYFFLGQSKPGERIIISHSNLFYWWPVWLMGFILTALTWIQNQHVAFVPAKTEAVANAQVQVDPQGKPEQLEKRDVFILPEGKKHWQRKTADGQAEIEQPRIYMAHNRTYGALWVATLLLVITITNIPLRGIWSFFIIILVVMLAVLFAVAGWWEWIFSRARLLAMHINMGTFLFSSIVLFIIWLVNFLLFDRQVYMVFSPGQLRVRLEIGGGETVYDTTGMVLQKQRSDLFRHWILGFGSGDLIVRPVGSQHHLDLPNVLRVGRRIKEIETLVKEKVVVTS